MNPAINRPESQIPSRPRFSVVIPTYNRPQMLSQCLECVFAGLRHIPAGETEIIVTDNSTDDSSQALVRERFPAARWVKGPGGGPAKNRNNGARVAGGQWLVFVDDDCVPSEFWLASFRSAISLADNTSVFEGCTVGDREQCRFDEEAPINTTGGYLWGCNFAIERELYLNLGGNCESFPYGYEDVDLRLRLRKAGKAIRFVPQAIVCHPLRRTRGLAFSLKAVESFLLLARRNPEILGNAPWRSMVLNLLRRIKQMLEPAIRYRFRGLAYIVGATALQTYAEARAASQFRSPKSRMN